MAKIDQIQLMKLVLAIQDKGSLTAAADTLNSSLPTVVRQLAALEAYLGVILFDRTTRKIHLTDEGAIYIEAARNMVSKMESLEISLTNRSNSINRSQATHNEAPSGNITITAPVMFGRMHVMPVVNAYMAKYSQATAQLVLQDTLTDLVESGIDIAFRIGEITIPNVIAIPIGHVHRVVCVSPDYLKRYPAINSPSDLKQARGIKNTALNNGNHWKFNTKTTKTNNPLKTQEIAVPITFICNNIDATTAHCLAGLGVGVFLSYQVNQLIQQGLLVEVLAKYRLPSTPILIIYLKTKRHLSRTRFFIDFAKNCLQAEFNYT